MDHTDKTPQTPGKAGEGRVVGIDYGRKKTGLAVSDPLGIFATALDTVDSAKLADYIQQLTLRMHIVRFVVGQPLNLNGQPAQAWQDVSPFLERLRKRFPDIPVSLEDERFTSVLAQRALIDGGAKAAVRRDKRSVDKISAAILLQAHLDRQASHAGLSTALPDETPRCLSRQHARQNRKQQA